MNVSPNTGADTRGPEHYDVVVVGAGLSGICAGHYLQTQCGWATYAIFEARGAIGGTWDLFRYPGIRSDSDMYTLGFGFRPWQGPKAIADGESIRNYIRDTAAEEGIDHKIQFHHRVVKADWSAAEALWRLTVTETESGASREVTCGFLFSCSGYYRYDQGYQPDFPGRDNFTGTFIHPQHWPEDLDYAGKRIVVIGSGATAITLVPSLARDAGHVTMLQRSPTYVVSLPDEDPIAQTMQRVLPKRVSGPAVKWLKTLTTQGMFAFSRKWPKRTKALLRRQLTRALPADFDIDRHFTPTYNPWDQRVCVVPNGDLFKVLRDGRASIVTDQIETITANGIRLQSGEELPADIIVSATGLDLLLAGGIEFTIDGTAADPSGRMAYKGMMLEGVPNFAIALGYTNASWTLKCELTCKFVTHVLNTMRNEGRCVCVPTNDDPTLTTEPLLPLSSGYVTRAEDRLPRQGSKSPWRVYQSYWRDSRTLGLRNELDPQLVLSNPATAAAADPAPIRSAS